MYNGENLVANIKKEAKRQGVRLKDMLADLGLGVNLLAHVAKGQNITVKNLQAIADYLHVSIDYLLGREVQFDSSILRHFKDAQPDPETTAALRRMMDETITVAYYNAPEEIRSAADRLLDPYKPEKSKDAPAS